MRPDLKQITQDLLDLPSESRMELAEVLLDSVHDFTTPEIEEAWRTEVIRRIEDFDSGRVKAIPAEKVFQDIRQSLSEIRRIPS